MDPRCRVQGLEPLAATRKAALRANSPACFQHGPAHGTTRMESGTVDVQSDDLPESGSAPNPVPGPTHPRGGGTAAPTAELLAVTRAPCLDHAVSSMPRRCTYRLRQLAGLVVCGLVLQRCAAGTEPSAPAPAPECSVTAAELSRPYVRIEHRSAPIGCERTRPCTPIRPSICSSHAECTEGVNGRCGSGGEGCSYDECFGDEDCPAGAVCDCAGGRDNHRCLPGECTTDDDCAEGLWCSPSTSLECPVGVVGFYCHTAADECVADGDCSDPSEFCAFDGARRAWVCTAQLCER